MIIQKNVIPNAIMSHGYLPLNAQKVMYFIITHFQIITFLFNIIKFLYIILFQDSLRVSTSQYYMIPPFLHNTATFTAFNGIPGHLQLTISSYLDYGFHARMCNYQMQSRISSHLQLTNSLLRERCIPCEDVQVSDVEYVRICAVKAVKMVCFIMVGLGLLES